MVEKVLDANVFIHSPSLRQGFDTPVTVPAVIDEMESDASRMKMELEGVSVYEPGEEAVKQVRERVAAMNEDLSETDIRLLALALERGAVLVTDDYGMQNIASSLGIGFEGFMKEEIDEEVEWVRICKRCGHEIDGDTCSLCGGEAKRVPG